MLVVVAPCLSALFHRPTACPCPNHEGLPTNLPPKPLLLSCSLTYHKHHSHSTAMSSSALPPLPRISARAQNLSPPSIEDVLDQYSDLPDTANLAMGVAHWGPPPSALRALRALGHVEEETTEKEEGAQKNGSRAQEKKRLHAYGPITGNADLVAALREKLETENHLDLTGACVPVNVCTHGLDIPRLFSGTVFLFTILRRRSSAFP